MWQHCNEEHTFWSGHLGHNSRSGNLVNTLCFQWDFDLQKAHIYKLPHKFYTHKLCHQRGEDSQGIELHKSHNLCCCLPSWDSHIFTHIAYLLGWKGHLCIGQWSSCTHRLADQYRRMCRGHQDNKLHIFVSQIICTQLTLFDYKRTHTYFQNLCLHTGLQFCTLRHKG